MKKLLAVLLVLVLSLSMVACGDKTKEAEKAVDEAVDTIEDAATDAVNEVEDLVDGEDLTAPADVTEGTEATTDLPELDGLTKMDMNGMTVYTNETGTSAIAVITAPSNDVVAEGIANKNEEALTELVEQQKASYEGAEITGEFVDIGSKTAYKLNMTIPANAEAGIPVDSQAVVFMTVSGDTIYVVSAADTSGGDVAGIAKQAEEVVAAL